MPHRTPRAFLIVTLVILSIPIWSQSVHASENLVISPIRGQEQNVPGATLSMTVTGAVTGQSYTYYWAVFQALGSSYRFATAGAFDIGLTDKLFYQRTEPISIKASGYNANDKVNVTITKEWKPVPGYPKVIVADTNGNVGTNWLTTANIPAGNYTVTLVGTTTRAKTPPDSQWFIINTASLAVTTSVTTAPSNVLVISSTIKMPDGSSFNQGNVNGLFSMSGQPVGSSIGLSYNQSLDRWTGTYTVRS